MDNVFAALFVAFFCVFASKDPGVRRKLSERILDEDVISLDVGEINKDTAERELDYWVKGSEDYGITSEELDSGIYQSSGYSDVEFSSRKLLSVSEHIPRRHLGHRRRKHRVLITASAPGPAQDSSPSPSPSHSPSSSPSPLPEPSDRAPPLNIPKPMQLPRNIIPPFPSNQRNNDTNDTNQQKYILAALVASLVLGVFLMALLLFVCLRKESRDDPKHEHKDEKPTLNLISSNINHSGSSAHTMSKSSGKDFKAPSTVPHQLSEPKPNEPQLLLPLPPGRTLAAAPLEPSSPPPPLPNPPAPAAPPPPPPKPISRPPNPPPPGPAKLSPLGPHHRRVSTGEASDGSNDSEAPKTKLKPFFWDKVLASPNHSMVWHEIKAGSFQFNEEMMESLFGYAPPADKNKNDSKKDSSYDSPPQFIQIIDPKKSQNLSILLKALNVTTEEVCQALQEGNELPPELTQTLLRMAPTSDEELRLRLYTGDISHLGPAERFLKAVVDIPFAFKRLESLLFVSTFAEDFSSTKDSLATLEVACTELRNSRLFLKLLEAVLKTGNRMNDGTYRGGAQAFKLDTLLKLSDVKGTDGKTTLLNFVVQEIIRSEGIRAARRLKESTSMSSVKTEDLFEESHREVEEYHRSLGLQVVSSLSNELQNVKKGAMIDTESLSETVHKLGVELEKTRAFLDGEMKDVEGENEFREALASFAERCESDIEWVKAEEKRIMSMVKSTGDYFHGRAGREESSQLFVIVRDFLLMLDKSCLEVKNASRLSVKTGRKEAASRVSASSASPVSGASESALEMHRQLFPAMRERQMDDDFDSSDDES